MSDSRVILLHRLIELTLAHKVVWKTGARKSQFVTTVRSGSIVLSKESAITGMAPIDTAPIDTARNVFGGLATIRLAAFDAADTLVSRHPLPWSQAYKQTLLQRVDRDAVYTVQLRDAEANVVETIASRDWLPVDGASESISPAMLYELVLDVKSPNEQRLRDFINDLDSLL